MPNILIINWRKFILLLLVSLHSTLSYPEKQVVFAIDIIRHGDRTPTAEIPINPYNWPEGLGELTAIGIQQEFSLGRNLRSIYIKQYGLLPEKYDSSSLYVRSSDFNRTLMSAQALLIGLYPLGTGPKLPHQPIPIHTVPKAEDRLLLPKPEFLSLIDKYPKILTDWQNKTAQYQPKFQHWSQVTGLSIKKLEDIIKLGDNLYIRKLHHVPMPTGIDAKNSDEIIKLYQWVVTMIYKPFVIGERSSKDLRHAIAEYLQQASTSDTKLKYVLFSAHDSTLLAIMSALHHPLETIPAYAADLNILLIKDTINGKYYVKTKYQDNPIKFENCANECSLTEFKTDLQGDS